MVGAVEEVILESSLDLFAMPIPPVIFASPTRNDIVNDHLVLRSSGAVAAFFARKQFEGISFFFRVGKSWSVTLYGVS